MVCSLGRITKPVPMPMLGIMRPAGGAICRGVGVEMGDAGRL
jgi:hypothetical protein